MRGHVKSVSRGQGTGYIRDDSGRDVFFHKVDVLNRRFNDLQVGTVVTFNVIEDLVSGARAQDIRLVRDTK